MRKMTGCSFCAFLIVWKLSCVHCRLVSIYTPQWYLHCSSLSYLCKCYHLPAGPSSTMQYWILTEPADPSFTMTPTYQPVPVLQSSLDFSVSWPVLVLQCDQPSAGTIFTGLNWTSRPPACPIFANLVHYWPVTLQAFIKFPLLWPVPTLQVLSSVSQP